MAPQTPPIIATQPPVSLEQAILHAGGVSRSASAGATAYQWQGLPRTFVLVTSGSLSVQFRTKDRQAPWAECRAAGGQDCMPVTAAILSARAITVRAVCLAPTRWLELSPVALILLVHSVPSFRHALFAGHARRLPTFFARISAQNTVTLDQRIADWLLDHARDNAICTTHSDIAAGLLTAREVVSRKLGAFAAKGWISQRRGLIQIEAPAALARVSRGVFSLCPAARAKRHVADGA